MQRRIKTSSLVLLLMYFQVLPESENSFEYSVGCDDTALFYKTCFLVTREALTKQVQLKLATSFIEVS